MMPTFFLGMAFFDTKEPKYYTIAEAMERFNLTRDQLYHYVKYHNIPRIKVGKYTKILRAELDKFFEPLSMGLALRFPQY